MKNSFSRIYCLAVCTACMFVLSSCKVGRFVYYNFADITDHNIFPARTAKPDSLTFYYAEAKVPEAPKNIKVNGKESSFREYLKNNETVAFLVIRNDTLLFEEYYDGYNHESVVASFSMAKSVTSLLIGCAIDDGHIKSVNEPVISYVPNLKITAFRM